MGTKFWVFGREDVSFPVHADPPPTGVHFQMTVESSSTTRVCPQCGTETNARFCGHDGSATVEKVRVAKRVSHSEDSAVIARRYRLEQPLAEGSLGVSYRATDLERDEPVLVQLLPPQLSHDLEFVARFQKEGRLVSVLDHPNIARVREFGVADDGRLFIAEELALGPTLGEVLQRSGPLDPRRIISIAKEIFSALAAAHASGLLHRSLGLDNVLLVTRPGLPEVVKVRCFGLAQALIDEEAEPFVWPAPLVSASPTMAPEQARGRGVSGHADIYSAGAVLYALITGRPVFSETSPSDLLVAHSVKIPVLPERDGRTLSGPLIDLVMQCLEKKPWNRPESAQKLIELLHAAGPVPIIGAPSPTMEFGPPPADARGPKSRTSPRPAYGVPPPTHQAPISREVRRPAPEPPRPRRLSNPRMAVEPEDAATRIVDRASLAKTRIVEESAPTRAMPIDRVARPEPSEPSVVVRRSPSPLVAFLLGLIFAGGLAALVVWLTRAPSVPEPARVEPVPEVRADNALEVGPTPEVAAEPDIVVPDAALSELPPDTSTSAEEVLLADVEPQDLALPDAQPPDVADVAIAVPLSDTVQEVRPADVVPLNDGSVADVAVRDTMDKSKKVKDVDNREVSKVRDPLADLEDPEFATPREAVARKILVDSDPGAATVSANGRVLGETPLYVEWQEGTSGVDISVSKPGYRTIRTRIGPGIGRAVKLNLSPVPPETP
jgi:serine/threonine protein kinase